MATTLAELKTETDKTFKDLTLQDWKDKSDYRGITKRSQKDFDFLIPTYVEKIGNIREQLRGNWSVTLIPIINDKFKTPEELGDELMEALQHLLDKETLLIDKFAACCKEVEMRKNGEVVRTNLHNQLNRYVDYANGTDGGGGTIHDGLAEPDDPGGSTYTAIDGTTTSTDGTHCCLALGGFDNDADDNYNGDYLYNVTRSAGVIISDYDADDEDGASVLIHPNIAGQVAGDTFYILRAVKKMSYVMSLVSAPGDVNFLRANTTWLQGTDATNILPADNGDVDNHIEVRGCGKVGDGDDDPWVDDNATLPIIDFEDAAYQLFPNNDVLWKWSRIDFRRSNNTAGMLRFANIYGWVISNCVFREMSATNQESISGGSGEIFIEYSTFYSIVGVSVYGIGSHIHLKSCTFNGGGDTTNYGLRSGGGVIYAEDCSFGQTTSHDVADVHASSGGVIYLRNCLLNQTPVVSKGGVIYSEDDDGTFESHIAYQYGGTITRDTGTVRGGGADSSAKMEPSAYCGVNDPLILGVPLKGFAQVWVAAGSYTVSVYARVGSAWDSALTAAECYIKTSELDNAGDASRVERQSAQQILNDGNWQAFTTSISPARDGWVYIWLYLEEYEDATEHIFVDVNPVVA